MPSLVRQSFRLGFLVAMLGLPLRDLAAQSGTIQGQVTDSSGGAVSGAIVTVEKTSLRVSTSASGRYTLRGVPARLVYFPDENHWVLKPQNSLLWHREVFAWLDRYIGRGPSR